MNQLPITLTLYYPTAAQFEAYLGFMAMLSIGFGLLAMSLPAFIWSSRKTIVMRDQNAWIGLLICLNPIGSFVIMISEVSVFRDGHSEFSGVLIYFSAPIASLFAFSAIT